MEKTAEELAKDYGDKQFAPDAPLKRARSSLDWLRGYEAGQSADSPGVDELVDAAVTWGDDTATSVRRAYNIGHRAALAQSEEYKRKMEEAHQSVVVMAAQSKERERRAFEAATIAAQILTGQVLPHTQMWMEYENSKATDQRGGSK